MAPLPLTVGGGATRRHNFFGGSVISLDVDRRNVQTCVGDAGLNEILTWRRRYADPNLESDSVPFSLSNREGNKRVSPSKWPTPRNRRRCPTVARRATSSRYSKKPKEISNILGRFDWFSRVAHQPALSNQRPAFDDIFFLGSVTTSQGYDFVSRTEAVLACSTLGMAARSIQDAAPPAWSHAV